MAQFGRNDQAVTANDVTTIEESNGAPIGTGGLVKWDKVHRADGANAHFGNTSPGTRANTDAAMYCNVTPSAFINNMAVGVFGVSPTEMANNRTNAVADRPAHAGWVVRRQGTGGIATAVANTNDNSVGYVTGDLIVVSNGTSNALLTVTSNSQGNIHSLAITSDGAGWINTTMAAVNIRRNKHVTSIAVSNTVYVTSVSVTGTAAGPGYANGDVVRFGNTASWYNAVSAAIATNSLGNLTAVSVSNGGCFVHALAAGDLVLSVTNSAGGTANGNTTISRFTPVVAAVTMAGYDNTSVVMVTATNNYVNGYSANLSTDGSGVVTTITCANTGVFGNTTAVADLTIAIVKYDGTTPTGNSVARSFVPALANSTGGILKLTIGGRAGRVHTETLIAMGTLGAQSASYGTLPTSNDAAASADESKYPGV